MRRPDLVDIWIFRMVDGSAEVLMLHRSPHRVLPGLWQGVSGLIEPDEVITAAALREVVEETGLQPSQIEAFFHLDFVAEFLWEPVNALMTAVYFAVRAAPDWEPTLSHEHDAYEWRSIDEAIEIAVWPAYREALGRIHENVLNSERVSWFELSLAGDRLPT